MINMAKQNFYRLENFCEKILLELNKSGFLINVYLAPDELMLQLNKKYRRKEKVADVLSFKFPATYGQQKIPYPETELCFLGEIYLASNLVNKKKDIFGLPVDYGLSVGHKLLIHGLLHLLGYTHAKKSDRIKMEKKENQLWQKAWSWV